MSAPYTGGFQAGSLQFAVDGNFASCDPCSPPKVSFPMKGDSVFSNLDILFFDNTGQYSPFSLGNYPNIQPWSSNQRSIVIEQDFMVAMENYIPLTLNLPYQPQWAIGWEGVLNNNQPIAQLTDCILVEEGPIEDMGQGIIKVTRKFANVPPTRNEIEQFTYTFPGIATTGRQQPTRSVLSRLQYDYFVFDDFDILGTPLFANGGNRLNGSTGLYPPGLILPAQSFYSPVANAVALNIFLPSDGFLSDASGSTLSSIPSASNWINWIQGIGTSNGFAPELIAESSCMRRWMGNIFERRTRFIQVQ